ncbi:general secretion pathway protein GspC [Yersinia hibernica]|uniref:General secretion pathway protein GspC n=2 Tax=Yersinia TaxID=629 RepID=A0A7U5PGG3_YEREN|nr:general secretion pathway protein GspC [Yersinia hibernica]
MLLLFNKIVMTPYRKLVDRKKEILDIIILLCILYQINVFFQAVINPQKKTIPKLYEGESIENYTFAQNTRMINEIKNSELFNRSDKELKNIKRGVVDVVNSPMYTGGLKLAGVLAHSENEKSIAIIEANGKQKLYFIYDEIENNTNITIVRILKDKIIIKENEEYYSLVIFQ